MKLMLIDGNSILNRAFYGVRLLSTKDGLYTNAIYGFLMILQKLLKESSPDSLAVAFDLKAPTFRHGMYDGYKATRKPMPEELAVQIPIIKEILDAMKIPRLELEGFEADDILGTISRNCDCSCMIVTGDRDSLQLINDSTHVLLITSRGGKTDSKEYDSDLFFSEYGFEPSRLIDLKALMGDSSDNIPGVAGVGEKTASDLLHRFGSLTAIYDNIESPDIRESVRKKLIAGKEAAFLSYDLATIDTNAPISLDADTAKIGEPDKKALYELFTRLEFTRLIDKFGLTPQTETQEYENDSNLSWRRITKSSELIDACSSSQQVYFVCPNDLSALAVVTSSGAYLALPSELEDDFNKLLKYFFSSKVLKVSHDIKPLMSSLIDFGIDFDGFIFDTALGAWLLDPSRGKYSLPSVSQWLLGKQISSETEYTGGITLSQLTDDMSAFSSLQEHAQTVAALYKVIAPKLHEYGMDELYNKIELPLCRVLAEMEHNGFLVDKQKLSDFGEQLGIQIDALQSEIYDLAGGPFNINSPKQLGEVLFDFLKLPAGKKTKTGYSTNVDVLERLRSKHPIIEKIIDFRTLTKLKSTYTDGLLKVIGSDGRIHTKFNMTATATGRLSSVEPNLQNIPVRKQLGGELRHMFVAGPGNVLVDADYSQIELRLLAHISGDETMRQAFIDGEDIHAVTASQVFNVPLDEVTSLQRSRAKAVNFGIVYGISEFSLAQDIGISRAEAKLYMDSYFSKYYGIRAYMKDIVEIAKRDGYVTTIFGRRRWLPELKSSNYNTRSFGERVALNMPIQGSAADIMKLAMVRVYERLKKDGLKSKLLLQIHDELICESPENEALDAARIITEEMQQVVNLSVPLIADANIGHSWYDAK